MFSNKKLVVVLAIMLSLTLVLSGCGSDKKADATKEVTAEEKAWVVDEDYINEMISKHRFTEVWGDLDKDSFPTSSDEAKEEFLSAIKSEDDGNITFNPLALIATLKAWQPMMLKEAEVSSWRDLVEEDKDGQLVATVQAKDLYEHFSEQILSDDYFVWFGNTPKSWTNSGSDKDGLLVVGENAGLTGNKLGWFVRSAETMEKAATEGLDPTKIIDDGKAGSQLARCGNPAWVEPPKGTPTGKTDEDDPPGLDPKDPSKDPVNNGNAQTGGGQNDNPGPGTSEDKPANSPDKYTPPSKPKPTTPGNGGGSGSPSPGSGTGTGSEDPSGDNTKPGGDSPGSGSSDPGGGTVGDDEGFI